MRVRSLGSQISAFLPSLTLEFGQSSGTAVGGALAGCVRCGCCSGMGDVKEGRPILMMRGLECRF